MRRMQNSMDSSFRPLTDYELALLNKLLEPDFPGRDELRTQMGSLKARERFEDGTLQLQCGPEPRVPVRARVPSEGECVDVDGVMIHVLLHVENGVMNELEVFKDDGSTICRRPSPDALALFTPCGEAGVKWDDGDSEAGGA
jgi:hypothetical protein